MHFLYILKPNFFAMCFCLYYVILFQKTIFAKVHGLKLKLLKRFDSFQVILKETIYSMDFLKGLSNR